MVSHSVSQCHKLMLFEVHYRVSIGLFFFCSEYFASKYKQEMLWATTIHGLQGYSRERERERERDSGKEKQSN